MYERFTDRARKVMHLANQEAQRFNHEYIGTEHLLLGLIQEGSGVAANVLKNLDIELRKVRLEVEKIVQSGPDMVTMGKLPQTPRAKKVIEYSIEEARNLNHNYIGTEHLLLGLLREQEGVAAQVLMNLGLKLEGVREEVLNLLGHNMASEGPGGIRDRRCSEAKLQTPALDTYGRDLTELAHWGKLDPVIGRTAEISRLVRVLCRRTRNCALLLGEAGVGKTAIVRGLAQLLAAGQVPDPLRNCRIVSVDLALLVACTGRRGIFEERLKAIVNEARRARNTILFLDDLHLWAYRQTVLASLAMNREDLGRCIAATTSAELAHIVARASSLERCFLPVVVSPLTAADSFEVLRGLRDRYEAHHGVSITDEALHTAIDLAARDGATGRIDRALDLIDEAAAEVHLRIYSCGLPELRQLDAEIEQLTREKENAVAEQDFDKAVHFRDQADVLKKRKDEITTTWIAKSRETSACVDAESVRQVAVMM